MTCTEAPDDVLPTMFRRIGFISAELHNALYSSRGGINADKARYALLGVPRTRPMVLRDVDYDRALVRTARRAGKRAKHAVGKDTGKKMKERTVIGKVLRELDIQKARN